ncbi:hypothetical protein [Fulvivirga ligni]|uniref:hypothetical protein n=1 Tax=Fulvivirga ligni TaxID=2904246 RepID=UPI001F30F325|nr:hypothetical protein [Fulvivirga ligni]UII19911.1 hypothetical protein LVD16_18880 [Fulvivirga ligni]
MKTHKLTLEPNFSLGAGWWVYDKANIQQWDRSHYIANFDVGFTAYYNISKSWNIGVGVNHSWLDEDELIAYNDNASRNKYYVSDGPINFNFIYATTELYLIHSKNYRLGPALAFGCFNTSAEYVDDDLEDKKTYFKLGLSNELGLSPRSKLHLQFQYVSMNIRPENAGDTKHLIKNLSFLFGVRFNVL